MRSIHKHLLFILLFSCSTASAEIFSLTDNNEVFGAVFSVTPKKNDTFSYYAHLYDVGAFAIIQANPGVNEDYPDKQTSPITIPAAYILPTKRTDVVINLPELRLYYFTSTHVFTYPISIGKVGWKTPVREGSIVDKTKNPSWTVPDSIMAENRAKGIKTPRVVPPGPNNPLGQYALRLSIPGYLIHGTNNLTSIGRRVSHGCIRMFPTDIQQLFSVVPVGANVSLINEPVKAGWRNNELSLVIYPLLHEYPMSSSELKILVTDTISNALQNRRADIDWSQIDRMIKEKSGVVEVISN